MKKDAVGYRFCLAMRFGHGKLGRLLNKNDFLTLLSLRRETHGTGERGKPCV